MGTQQALAAKWQKYYETFPITFWNWVDQSGGPEQCWPFTGTKRKAGYGKIAQKGKWLLAHRVAFELHYQQSPGALHVRHSCDNPSCCNPRHLSLGTHTDNMRDRSERGRAPIHRAKLDAVQVADIRAKLAGGRTGASLALEYNVSQSAISQIKLQRSWGAAFLRAREAGR